MTARTGVAATRTPETGRDAWPALPYAEWKDTLYALHMWTQVVGKIRLALTPLVNHWWNSTLAVTPRGLSTGLMPTASGALQIDFDLIDHELVMVTSDGQRATVALGPMPVAEFYRAVMDTLARLRLDVRIVPVPVEVAIATPFADDRDDRPYDREMVARFHRILVGTQIVFDRFRSEFLGKASPAHFFWGGFDLASARFSGRRGPAYAGGSAPNVNIHVMHEAYSHELIAAGFWPGSDSVEKPEPEFYSYAMPAPSGLAGATIEPEPARWVDARGEFILPYDAVRNAADPGAEILSFLRSTYDAAADLGDWDRELLEDRVACACALPPPSRSRRSR